MSETTAVAHTRNRPGHRHRVSPDSSRMLGQMFATRPMLILVRILDFCDTRQSKGWPKNAAVFICRAGASAFCLVSRQVPLGWPCWPWLAGESLLRRAVCDETYVRRIVRGHDLRCGAGLGAGILTGKHVALLLRRRLSPRSGVRFLLLVLFERHKTAHQPSGTR